MYELNCVKHSSRVQPLVLWAMLISHPWPLSLYLFSPYKVDIISTSLPPGSFQKPPITATPLSPPRWDSHAWENEKRPSRFHVLSVENKSTPREVRRCGAVYVDVNNSGWSKSTREDFFYVPSFSWGRKMALVYIVWMRAGGGGGLLKIYEVKKHWREEK